MVRSSALARPPARSRRIRLQNFCFAILATIDCTVNRPPGSPLLFSSLDCGGTGVISHTPLGRYKEAVQLGVAETSGKGRHATPTFVVGRNTQSGVDGEVV